YETLPGLNDITIPALAPLPTGETEDTKRVVERFGEDILAAGTHDNQQIVYVKADRLIDSVKFIKTEPNLAYEALIDVTAIERSKLPIGDSERFHAVYQLRSYQRKKHLMVISPASSGDNPTMPSLTPLFQAANWPEREVLDLMGFTFTGHPDPRR